MSSVSHVTRGKVVVAGLALLAVWGCGQERDENTAWHLDQEGDAGFTDVDGSECTADANTETACNGRDDDCDGEVDEGLARECPLQEGVCVGSTVSCRGGAYPDCSAEAYGPDYVASEGPDDCDGLDNDCDGQIDEACECEPGEERTCYSGAPETRGRGECRAGTQVCRPDHSWGECVGERLPADEETCGGGDEDCDGVVDEGCSCAYRGNDTGVCAGQTRGPDGNCQEPESYEPETGPESTCDGLDNDCDGEVDEGCRPCNYDGEPEGVCADQRRPAGGECPKPETYEAETAVEQHCDGRDNDCDGMVDEGCYTAAVPTSASFGWQSTQPRLRHEETGEVCDSRITIQVSEEAMCSVERETNQLRCAGRVHDKNFGTSFTDHGRTNVDQVLISEDSEDICTLADNTVKCFGQNEHGYFGTGDADSVPASSPVVWGGRHDVAAIGTGSWDNLCAVTTAGEIYCAGERFGASPIREATGSTFWVDKSGALQADPDYVVGLPGDSTSCTVRKLDTSEVRLDCPTEFSRERYGSRVVAGSRTKKLPDDAKSEHGHVCWLAEDTGVKCERHDPYQGLPRTYRLFDNIDVAALGISSTTSTRCAVGRDGSIWCVGDNTSGKLGTGDTDDLGTETRVQPPGSVRFGCF